MKKCIVRALCLVLFASLCLSLAGCESEIVMFVEAEGDLSLAYCDGGVYYVWGDGSLFASEERAITSRQLLIGITEAIDVAAGESHAIWLTGGGVLMVGPQRFLPIGSNTAKAYADLPVLLESEKDEGSVYNGADGTYVTASVSESLRDVVRVAASDSHTMVLKENGTVWAWGMNNLGQLGTGGAPSTYTATRVGGLDGISDIAAGPGGNCAAIDMDGGLWVWGGAVGEEFSSPRHLDDISGVKQVACGRGFYLALKEDGTVWLFSDGTISNIALTSGADPTEPRQLDVPASISVVAGDHFAAILDVDGGVHTLGANDLFQLGRPTEGTSVDETPAAIESLSGIVSIAAGRNHCVALQKDGTVWAWGDNSHGQLGTGDTEPRTEPVRVSGFGG